MCGIAGLFNLDLTPLEREVELTAMRDALKHRGPDDEGSYCEGPVGLVHCRLSIIDLNKRARQPIMSPCGRVCLTFNGEIYNYIALKKELEAYGYCFVTQSDSEVLAAALAHWREKALTKITGMFAFAAWFVQEQRLLLARDRTGIKPLVYQQQGHAFVFASELTALKKIWTSRPRIDVMSLHHYLALGHINDRSTLLEGVKRLPAGHYLWAGDEIPSEYWRPEIGQDDGEHDHDYLKELMERVVSRHMLSDRPIGLMLSGGLDSSILAYYMSRHADQLHAYTVEYPFITKHLDFSEKRYAQIVADAYGIKLHTIDVTEQDVLDQFETLGSYMDEPNAGPALLPLYCGYQKLKDQVTVVIDGAGADECFAGYRKYLVSHAWDQTRWVPRFLKYFTNAFGVYGQTGDQWLKKGVDSFLIDQQLAYRESDLKDLLQSSYDDQWMLSLLKPFEKNETMPMTSQMQYFDLKNHMIGWGNSLLDRVSMAHGIECRVPYQDHQLIDYVFSLKETSRIHWPTEKWLLKETYRDVIPQQILKRRKMGFSSPLKHFLRFGLKEVMCDLLSHERLKRQGFFDERVVGQMIDQTLSLTHNHTNRLWPLLQFQLWYDKVLMPQE